MTEQTLKRALAREGYKLQKYPGKNVLDGTLKGTYGIWDENDRLVVGCDGMWGLTLQQAQAEAEHLIGA